MGLNLQIAIKEIVNYSSPSCRGLNFTKPINDDGTPTRYFTILKYLMANGPSRRLKINADVLGLGPECRGHYNSVFAGLRASGLIKYNTKGCTWTVGEKFSAYNRAVESHAKLQEQIKQYEA